MAASASELDTYYEVMRPRLYACAEARSALRMSFNPAVLRALLPLRLVAPPVNTLAFAALPRWARRMYGAPASSLTDLAATTALKALYRATTGLPERVRYTPPVRRALRRVRDYERQQAVRLRAVS